MSTYTQSQRGTLYEEQAELTEVHKFAGDQYVIRLHAPKTALHARPGSFVHLRCDESIPMRRPLSIMRANAEAGWIDILFKTHGEGLAALAQQTVGAKLRTLGPIGQPFRPSNDRPLALLIGGGVGIPPMVFLAEALRRAGDHDILVLMGSELPFPFEMTTSDNALPGIDASCNATMADLDRQKIPTRLASKSGFEGCFDGYVTELASAWLSAIGEEKRSRVEVFACGPTPMLAATAAVAHRFQVPAQVSLEEYMACAVGGCAGCTVQVHEPDGVKMKRVCVDGPVFRADQVFPQTASAD